MQVRFINAAADHIGTEAAYAHGAHLVLLDGIGLGVGMPLQVCLLLFALYTQVSCQLLFLYGATERGYNGSASHQVSSYIEAETRTKLDGWCLNLFTTMQVAEALRDKCQHFLAEQLPEHQLDVARAAGTLAAFNESNGRSTDEDMTVDENSPAAAAGMPLAGAV